MQCSLLNEKRVGKGKKHQFRVNAVVAIKIPCTLWVELKLLDYKMYDKFMVFSLVQ